MEVAQALISTNIAALVFNLMIIEQQQRMSRMARDTSHERCLHKKEFCQVHNTADERG